MTFNDFKTFVLDLVCFKIHFTLSWNTEKILI